MSIGQNVIDLEKRRKSVARTKRAAPTSDEREITVAAAELCLSHVLIRYDSQHLRTVRFWSAANLRKSCTSRYMPQNEDILAQIGFDTAVRSMSQSPYTFILPDLDSVFAAHVCGMTSFRGREPAGLRPSPSPVQQAVMHQPVHGESCRRPHGVTS